MNKPDELTTREQTSELARITQENAAIAERILKRLEAMNKELKEGKEGGR